MQCQRSCIPLNTLGLSSSWVNSFNPNRFKWRPNLKSDFWSNFLPIFSLVPKHFFGLSKGYYYYIQFAHFALVIMQLHQQLPTVIKRKVRSVVFIIYGKSLLRKLELQFCYSWGKSLFPNFNHHWGPIKCMFGCTRTIWEGIRDVLTTHLLSANGIEGGIHDSQVLKYQPSVTSSLIFQYLININGIKWWNITLDVTDSSL